MGTLERVSSEIKSSENYSKSPTNPIGTLLLLLYGHTEYTGETRPPKRTSLAVIRRFTQHPNPTGL